MDVATGLALIVSAITAIATIVGWTVVYRQQKEMIAAQNRLQAKIAADNEKKEKKKTQDQLLLDKIDYAYEWVQEGHDILLTSETADKSCLKQRMLEWQLKYSKEINPSEVFDSKYAKETKRRDIGGRNMYQVVYSFYEYVVAVVNSRAEGDETKALDLLTNGEYKTWEPDVVKAEFWGFNILLPEGFWNDYGSIRSYLKEIRKNILI